MKGVKAYSVENVTRHTTHKTENDTTKVHELCRRARIDLPQVPRKPQQCDQQEKDGKTWQTTRAEERMKQQKKRGNQTKSKVKTDEEFHLTLRAMLMDLMLHGVQ